MTPQIPAHVPPELVVDFDRFSSPVLQRCPHRGVADLFKNSPDIFYTTGDRGHWVVASATLARASSDLSRYTAKCCDWQGQLKLGPQWHYAPQLERAHTATSLTRSTHLPASAQAP